jgi:NRPS condensation-like uncharacterized protein
MPMQKRKMLFTERLMYVDGQTPVNCVITARLRGFIDYDALTGALDKVQKKHPLLRATVENADAATYFVIHDDPPKVPVRMVARDNDDVWRQIVLDEWMTPFDMSRNPPLRFVWIKGVDVSELMLISHHCISDGASIVSILRETLLCLDCPSAVLEDYAPFESLKDLLPSSVYEDSKLMQRARLKAKLFRIFATFIPSRSVRPTGQYYFLYWKATAEESSTLIRRCKEQETTPYSSLCVAFLRAFRDVGKSRFKDKVVCPVDVRKFVVSLRSDMLFNYAPTISLNLGKDRDVPFWLAAKKLKQSIHQKVERLSVFEEMVGGEMLHGAVDKLISLLLRSKGTYDFAFSNVGRLDIPDTYKTFRVEEFLGVSVAVPWRNSTTIITTYYNGQIDVTFVANEEFLPIQEGRAIQHHAINVLKASLSL